VLSGGGLSGSAMIALVVLYFMTLPETIRKMTSFLAQRLGIPDRSLLYGGFKVDSVVFDAQHVKHCGVTGRRHSKEVSYGSRCDFYYNHRNSG
jgi:N-acyl-D-aspartate/D-glutamate deacylase